LLSQALAMTPGLERPDDATVAARRLSDAVPLVADLFVSAGRPGVHRDVLALVERALLAHVLARTRGNQLQAARLLGLNRNTLHKRCRRLGLLLSRPARARAAAG
jgi:two-component system nitrogen regulation response regulator GlnG